MDANFHEEAIKFHKKKIDQLKVWCKDQTMIPASITDVQIVLFLNCCEYNVEEAKTVMKTNYVLKARSPDIFRMRDPFLPELQNVWDSVHITLLPKTTQVGYRIVYLGFRRPDPKVFDLKSSIKLLNMILDTVMMREQLCPGYVVILNSRDVTLSHFPLTCLPMLRRELTYVQEGIQVKIKEIHVINCSPIVEKIYFIVKPFLSKALVEVLNFHRGEMEEFYRSVPKTLLPVDVGGTAESCDELCSETREKVEDFKKWFVDEETQRETEENPSPTEHCLKMLELD